jgi:hypothetical protein
MDRYIALLKDGENVKLRANMPKRRWERPQDKEGLLPMLKGYYAATTAVSASDVLQHAILFHRRCLTSYVTFTVSLTGSSAVYLIPSIILGMLQIRWWFSAVTTARCLNHTSFSARFAAAAHSLKNIRDERIMPAPHFFFNRN